MWHIVVSCGGLGFESRLETEMALSKWTNRERGGEKYEEKADGWEGEGRVDDFSQEE